MRNRLKTLRKHIALGCKMDEEQIRKTLKKRRQEGDIYAFETVYVSAVDFFR